MRILHINTLDHGGAAIAARRLHEGLVQAGHDSRMLIQHQSGSGEDRTIVLDREMHAVAGDPLLDSFFELVYQTCRLPDSDILLSTDRPTRDLARHPEVQAADVINLHWVAWMLSAPAVAEIAALGKPVVWTLHDQFPFTGGCHYSGGCRGFVTGCGDCPLVRPDAWLVPRLVLERKRRWIDPGALTVVSPSEWLAACARESAVFRNADVRVIPYGVPVEDFQRPSRESARSTLGVPPGAVVLLFGADNVQEHRKGYAHLAEALRELASHPVLGPRISDGSMICLSFGRGVPPDPGVPVRHLGPLSGERLAAAYRAADLFVLPTLEDNLPNTMLESIAAGTPVVAYRTGGVPDIVERGACGVIAKHGDPHALAEAIAGVASNAALRARLSAACKHQARTRLGLSAQARAYVDLYRELLASGRAKRRRLCVVRDVSTEDARTFELIARNPALAAAPAAAFQAALSDYQSPVQASSAPVDDRRAARLQEQLAELARLGEDVARAARRVHEESLLHNSGSPLEWLVRSRAGDAMSSPLSGEGVAGLISVIVPAFNSAAYLEQAVRSVWSQTLPSDRMEIVVVDDGSSDGTYELALQLQAQSPVRMQVLTHEGRANRGVSASRNLALSRARGELIALLDSDDVYLPDRLAAGAAYLERYAECDAVCSFGHYIDGSGRHVAGPNGIPIAGAYRQWGLKAPFSFEQLWRVYPVVNSSLLVRRTAMAHAVPYPEDMANQAEDRLIVLKLSLRHPVHCLEQPLILYRHHPANYTSQYVAHGFEDGVRLELLYHLVHYMTATRPEWRETGLRLFRAEYPKLIAHTTRRSRARQETIERLCSQAGVDVDEFLSARARERAELDVLRRVVPAALRDARDARAEVARLRAEIARLATQATCV